MKRLISVFVAAVIVLGGCTYKNKEESITVFAMDTVMSLSAYGENAADALRKAEAELLRLDAIMRRGSELSEVYKINCGKTVKSGDLAELLNRTLQISDSTGGALDPTVAPVMDLWGFYNKEYKIPSEAELAEALSRVDFKNISLNGDEISLKNSARLDLGAVAKGYASERALDILKENGVASAIVSLGGNVQAVGTRPDGKRWLVAVQNPNGGEYIGKLKISAEAVVTSGSYQRYFERDGKTYHHIIDPKTGCPAENGLKSVTIISEDAVLADGLSTALFVMGLEGASEYWRKNGGFEAVFVTEENKIYVTEGAEPMFESGNKFEIIT